MTTVYPVSTSSEIWDYIQHALDHPDHSHLLPFSPDGDVRQILDEIWEELESPLATNTYRGRLRRLSLKLVTKYDKFPTPLVLQGVDCTDNQQHGAGGFADVFCGAYRGGKVGLKRLRMYLMMANDQKDDLKKAFYRESVIWKHLVNKHVLPFLGVAEDVFPDSVCMVIPWMENGNLRHYIEGQLKAGKLDGDAFEDAIVKWLLQTAQGLTYLHGEGIVHGDLHAGNLLVDENGAIRLTDFGLALIAEGTSYNYGSQHGGGATRWTAPELFDPEEFGFESSRPTPESDIYALACINVELCTGRPPFGDLSDRQIPLRVVRGDRPTRPLLRNGKAMSDPLWSLTEACWSHDVAARPSSDAVVNTLAGLVSSPGQLDSRLQTYLDHLKSAVENETRGSETSVNKAAWMQRALLRTVDFYINGPRQPLSWVLAYDRIPESIIPPGVVTITMTSSDQDVAGRSWSYSNDNGLESCAMGLTSPAIAEFDGFRVMKPRAPYEKPRMHEVLVASARHVRWVTIASEFTLQDLQILHAVPVDIGDPPGPLVNRRWGGGRDGLSLWIARSAHFFMTPTSVGCVEDRGTPESSVFGMQGIHNMDQCQILCYVD